MMGFIPSYTKKAHCIAAVRPFRDRFFVYLFPITTRVMYHCWAIDRVLLTTQ